MGKTFVILTCLCAVAYAQFGQFQSRTTAQTRQQQQQSAFGNQNLYRDSQGQYQQNQNQYQQNQYQQSQQQSAPRQSAGSCRESNERYPVSGSCDRYIECINGTSEEKLCPDGLLFNPNVNFNVYPCQYPNEVQCLERSSLQPAQPTEDCPHQFGYYKLGDARNCSGFRNCVNGVGYDFTCPEGLAWSSETYRCEWPDTVADCDAEAFLGFRCPEVPQSRELGPPAGFRFYRSDVNCQKYFLCIEGRPRALSCGGDSAFDDLTSTCVSAEEVAACPQELRAAAAQARAEEKQRLAKEIEFYSKPNPFQKRKF
ncbi:protein obstructor-E-like [Pectinophora gossypiella]|uniref:protein obstructor-E-like n=1 Tax=Pectinophora gossypiella TaxID=13191 RepID=UPI00214EC06A|nr:protein obstructor-E-like [Pectinophora gossypiella]